MLKTGEIRRLAAQRLRELFPKAKGWEELADLQAAGKLAGIDRRTAGKESIHRRLTGKSAGRRKERIGIQKIR